MAPFLPIRSLNPGCIAPRQQVSQGKISALVREMKAAWSIINFNHQLKKYHMETQTKTPTLHPATAVRFTKCLLIFSFALLGTAGFAQDEFKNPRADHFEPLYSELNAWEIESNVTVNHLEMLALATEPKAANDNVTIIDQLYQAFAKGDVPGALANMDPKIVWNEAESFPYADGNPYIGPQAVVDGVFARIGAEWEYWNLTGIELHEMANDKVLATLRYQAKYKKNGAVIDAQTAHFWTLKDGKITHFQQYTDTDQVVRAVAQ